MIGGAGVRGCEAADYLRETSACKGQKLGGAKAPLAPLAPPVPPPLPVAMLNTAVTKLIWVVD